MTVLMNIHSKEGRVFVAGEAVSDPDTIGAKLEHGYRAWINDSYWLVMPYKLKDSGVTPQNKYAVWIDQESHLVTQ